MPNVSTLEMIRESASFLGNVEAMLEAAAVHVPMQDGLLEKIRVCNETYVTRFGVCCPERAECFLGEAQMIGIFAFQAARRLLCGDLPVVPRLPRLHPRPRDCVVLAGRG